MVFMFAYKNKDNTVTYKIISASPSYSYTSGFHILYNRVSKQLIEHN